MSDRCLCEDFELRDTKYELWHDSDGNYLTDGHNVIDTDHAFDPPLTNDELLRIYDYGKGY